MTTGYYAPPRFHPHGAPTPPLAQIKARFVRFGLEVRKNAPHSVTMATRVKYQTYPITSDARGGWGDCDSIEDLYNYLRQLETVDSWLNE